MKKTFATVLAVLGLIVIVSTALAAPAAAEVPLPFKGTIREATETHEVIFPYFYVNGNGSGIATQLGLFTYSYQARVRLPERIGEGVSAHFIGPGRAARGSRRARRS